MNRAQFLAYLALEGWEGSQNDIWSAVKAYDPNKCYWSGLGEYLKSSGFGPGSAVDDITVPLAELRDEFLQRLAKHMEIPYEP